MKKIIFILVIIIISSIFLPKYLFNSFENKSQTLFTTIEDARDKNDYKKVKALLLTHKSILNNQKKMVFLLPKKYAEYFKLKNDLYNKYYLALDKFVVLKEHEAGIAEVFKNKEELNNKTNAMDVYILLNTYVSKKTVLTKYKEEGFITNELYNAFLEDMDQSVSVYNNLIDNKIIEIKKIDLVSLYEDSKIKIDLLKQKEWIDIYKEADQELYLVVDYYNKNKLGKIIKSNKYEATKADLNGDGKDETLVLTNTLIAYDENNKELGRLPEYFPLTKPIVGSAKVYIPKNDNKNQFVIYDFNVQNNEVKSMMFGLLELKNGGFGVLPICNIEKPKNILDCYFSKDEINF